MSTNINIVILAAGLGTRMKSKRAKVLHKAGGMTLVEHVVAGARELTEANRITVVVGHQAEQVQQILSPQGVGFAVQREQKGTGHAVLMAREVMPAWRGAGSGSLWRHSAALRQNLKGPDRPTAGRRQRRHSHRDETRRPHRLRPRPVRSPRTRQSHRGTESSDAGTTESSVGELRHLLFSRGPSLEAHR